MSNWLGGCREEVRSMTKEMWLRNRKAMRYIAKCRRREVAKTERMVAISAALCAAAALAWVVAL